MPDPYYQQKTAELKAILKWISKAFLFVILISLIEYLATDSVSISGIVGGLLMAWFISWALSKREPNTD